MVLDIFGAIVSCKNRRYLDLDVHFSWRDSWMLFECILFNRLSAIYLQYILPNLPGGNSFDPVPVDSKYVNEYTFPPMSFIFFLGLYFSCAGFFHYFYYAPRGAEYLAKNKIQKNRKIVWNEASRKDNMGTIEDEKLFWKAISTSLKGILSVAFICNWQLAIMQGKTKIYWTYSAKSPFETALWFLVGYLALDFVCYWNHRMLHWPWLYRHVHKMHHIWKSPSAWVVNALVPWEFLQITSCSMAALTSIPLWFPAYIFLVLFTFFYNTMDHSGVEIHSIWFWQAPVNFHDNHHKYFHVNYAPMVDWWDKLFGSFYYDGDDKTKAFGEDNFHNHWDSTPLVSKNAKD